MDKTHIMEELENKKAIITGFGTDSAWVNMEFCEKKHIKYLAFDKDEIFFKNQQDIDYYIADYNIEEEFKALIERLNAHLEGFNLFFIHLFLEPVEDEAIYLSMITRQVWILLKYSIPYIAQNGGGSIIMFLPDTGGEEIKSLKLDTIHATIGLLRSVAVEASNLDVRINLIHLSDGWQQCYEDFENTLVFLCSEDGRFITGSEHWIKNE